MNKVKNNCTIEQLEILRDKIQNIENDKQHHLKILEIIKNNNANYSENSNGVFVNMNNLESIIIEKIKEYLIYIEQQNKKFEDVENIKNQLKKDYLTI
jgi:hypothetical protein